MRRWLGELLGLAGAACWTMDLPLPRGLSCICSIQQVSISQSAASRGQSLALQIERTVWRIRIVDLHKPAYQHAVAAKLDCLKSPASQRHWASKKLTWLAGRILAFAQHGQERPLRSYLVGFCIGDVRASDLFLMAKSIIWPGPAAFARSHTCANCWRRSNRQLHACCWKEVCLSGRLSLRTYYLAALILCVRAWSASAHSSQSRPRTL